MAGVEGLSDELLEATISCLRIRDLGRSCYVCVEDGTKITHKADEKIWKHIFLQLKIAVQKSRTARECTKGPQFYKRMLCAYASSWNAVDNHLKQPVSCGGWLCCHAMFYRRLLRLRQNEACFKGWST